MHDTKTKFPEKVNMHQLEHAFTQTIQRYT